MDKQKVEDVGGEGISNKQYLVKIHKICTATMLMLLVMTLLPAIYMAVVHDGFPGWNVIGGIFVALLGQEGYSWILEPTEMFVLIGVVGTYISYTAGNVGTMRFPAILAGRNAVNAKNGTLKSEAAGVFALVASVLMNLIILGIIILFGEWLLTVLPQQIVSAFDYGVPAVYGVMLATVIGVFKK